MPASGDLHRRATQVLTLVMVLVGLALVVAAVARGGGALSTGVVFGLVLGGAGLAGRRLERRG